MSNPLLVKIFKINYSVMFFDPLKLVIVTCKLTVPILYALEFHTAEVTGSTHTLVKVRSYSVSRWARKQHRTWSWVLVIPATLWMNFGPVSLICLYYFLHSQNVGKFSSQGSLLGWWCSNRMAHLLICNTKWIINSKWIVIIISSIIIIFINASM